jgi:hypothetical protein
VATLALALGAPLLSLAIGLAVNALFDDKVGALMIIAVSVGAFGLAGMVAGHLRQYYVPQPREELAAVKRIEKRLQDSLNERAPVPVDIQLDLRAPASDGVQRRVTQAALVARIVGTGGGAVLVGPEGSGKSAIATRVAMSLASERIKRRSNPVPLLLSLATWDASSTLRRWAVEEGLSHYSIPRTMTSRWFRTGRLTLILDGAEALTPEQIQEAAKQMNVLTDKNKCGILVTAELGTLSHLTHFRRQTEAAIAPISPEAFWEALTDYYPVLLRREQRKNVTSLRASLESLDERLAWLGLLSPQVDNRAGAPTAIIFGDRILREERNLQSAKDAYSIALGIERYRAPVLARLALVSSLEGDHAEATELFREALSVHLAASISTARVSVSSDDAAFLRALHVGVRYDAPRAAAAARLGLDQAAEKLARLTGEGWLASERGLGGQVHFLAATPPGGVR